MTAMVVLTANRMRHAQHDKVASDRQLVDSGLQLVNRMVEETKSEALRSFEEMCTELHQHAQRRSHQAITLPDHLDHLFPLPRHLA